MRTAGRALASLLVIGLFACNRGELPSEMLFLRTPTGIATLNPATKRMVFQASRAVPSHDWSRVFQSVSKNGSSQLSALDPSTGSLVYRWVLDGELEVKVVSRDGNLVALSSPRKPSSHSYPEGRETTPIVIARTDAQEPRRIEIPGNFEPEAFSLDGSSLFLVEYLPPLAPDHYRVRRLDLASSEVTGVFSVDSQLQESMKGIARTQTRSPEGELLYTLYSTDDEGAQPRAFIHVLSLAESWAHCIDLPSSLGIRAQSRTAITTSPDGRIYVVDTAGGSIAEVDPSKLKVLRTARFRPEQSGIEPRATVGPDGRIFVGSGSAVIAFDKDDLKVSRSWQLDAVVTGIQTSADGNHLYTAMGRRIVVLDATTGKTVSAFEVDGVETITELGRLDQTLDGSRTNIAKTSS